MDNLRQVSAPSHLTWRQDVHIQMMNVHRNSNVNEIIKEYRHLQSKGLFTDCTLVTAQGEKRCVHSLVLFGNSDLLRRWVEGTFIPNMEFTIILPNVSLPELDILISILYGVDVLVPRNLVAKVYDVIDLLGISVDIPIRTEETNEASSNDPPPLCCWHCDVTFETLEALTAHVTTHQAGSFLKKRQHRCSKCKKAFPSMWRLRQHLSEHIIERKTMISTIGQVEGETVRAPPFSDTHDHLYANVVAEDDITRSEVVLAVPENQNVEQKDDSKQQAGFSETQSDHLYSARKLSQEEQAELAAKKEQQNQLKKTDHLYSTPSSPSSPSAGNNAKVKKLRAEAKKGNRKKKKQSIQALGHSYAAALPRRVPSSEGGLRKNKSIQMFPCDQCDKQFPQPYRLNRHIREVHIKERRHSCQYCSKAFFKLTSKERHELTHAIHDMWRCEKCEKVFRDQSSLIYHDNKKVCQKEKTKKNLGTKK